jgi:hypothetical protein
MLSYKAQAILDAAKMHAHNLPMVKHWLTTLDRDEQVEVIDLLRDWLDVKEHVESEVM